MLFSLSSLDFYFSAFTKPVIAFGCWGRALLVSFSLLVLSNCSASQTIERQGLAPFGIDAYSDPPRALEPWAGNSAEGRYLAALVALRNKDFDYASELFQKLLEEDHSQTNILANAFYAAALAGDIRLASDLAGMLLAVRPDSEDALLTRTLDSVQKGNWTEAQQSLKAFPKRNIMPLVANLLGLWASYALGDLNALEAAAKVVEEDYQQTNLVIMQRALMAEFDGDREKATVFYDGLLKANSASIREKIAAANFFARIGAGQKATEIFSEILDKDPREEVQQSLDRLKAGQTPRPLIANEQEAVGEILFALGGLFKQEKIYDEALLYFWQSTRLLNNVQSENVLLAIASIYVLYEKNEAALRIYEAFPEDSFLAWNVKLEIAQLQSQLGQDEAALKTLEQVIAARPEQLDPYQRKGRILASMQRFQEAAKAYDQAIDRLERPTEDHWVLYYLRGISFEQSDHWEQAEADFLKALELKKDQPYALNYLAYAWVERKIRLKEAEKMLIKAVDQSPGDGYIVDSLGWAYYRLVRYDEAVHFLERAIELQPQESTINDHLGDAYWRVDRRHEARFQWRRALSFEPTEKERLLILEKLEKGL